MKTTNSFYKGKKPEEKSEKRQANTSKKQRKETSKSINKRLVLLKKKLNLYSQNHNTGGFKLEQEDLYTDPYQVYKKLMLSRDKWKAHGKRLMTRRYKKSKNERKRSEAKEEFDRTKLEKIQKLRAKRVSILRRNKTVGNFKIKLNNQPFLNARYSADPMNKTFSFKRTSKYEKNSQNGKKNNEASLIFNGRGSNFDEDMKVDPLAGDEIIEEKKNFFEEKDGLKIKKSRFKNPIRVRKRKSDAETKIQFKMYRTFDENMMYNKDNKDLDNSRVSKSFDFSKRLYLYDLFIF